MKDYSNLTQAQHETIQSMQRSRGQLIVWPHSLTWDELKDLERRGLVYHVNHGPTTYGETTYHLEV